MKNTTTLETDNLVLFPSAKNFSVEADLSDLSDPMMDLLNEFSHLSDDEFPDYLDDRFAIDDDVSLQEEDGSEAYSSLEAFMNRHKNESMSLSPDEKLAAKINEQFEAILEARAKIKFYLDEIDMFLPKRR